MKTLLSDLSLQVSALLLLLALPCAAREYPIEIVRAVDGDTVIAHVSMGFGMELRNVSIRLANANAPERSSGAPGKAATAWIVANAVGKTGVLITGKAERDKYGRALGTIRVGELDLGEALKAAGHAHGGPGRRD
jgi:endonuclease YncB( thermonuclease family)